MLRQLDLLSKDEEPDYNFYLLCLEEAAYRSKIKFNWYMDWSIDPDNYSNPDSLVNNQDKFAGLLLDERPTIKKDN